MRIVSNTSPLILFAKIAKFDLLQELFETLYISQETYHEIVDRGRGRPGQQELIKADWIIKQSIDIQGAVKQYKIPSLTEEDCTVVKLAVDFQADLVLVDDGPLRQVIRSKGLLITGCGGILIKAKQEGLIFQVKPFLDKLIKQGLRLSLVAYQTILQQINEK